MSDYYILITDAGAALEASAHAAGTTVKLDKFGVCDGGVDFIPDPAATTFSNEVFQSDISSLTVSADDATVMVAQCIIPSSSGGYTIRGIAIYTDDGTLYATGNYPAQPKPAPDSGFAASLEILAQLAVSDTADVSLTVTEGNFLTETQGNTLYLRQDKRLSEIAAAGAEAQSAARDNLALGTAATATLTTSSNDNTIGHVLKVGDRGLGCTVIPHISGFDFNLYEFSAGETLFIESNSAINFPLGMPELANTYVYVNVVGIRDSNNDCALLFSRYDSNVSYLVWRESNVDLSKEWQTLKIPANATDIGALPITGGNLLGGLGFSFQDARTDAGCLIDHFGAGGFLACGYGYYQDRFDIHFYDDAGAWASNPLSISRNGNTTINGDVSGNGIYDYGQRVYSPNNPPPATDLSGYQRANTASLANPGWFKDTNTGLITQWGWKDGVGGPNCLVNLPIAFPSDISSVQVTYQSVGGREYSPSVHNQGLSSFQVDCDNDGNAIYWVAIGR